MALRNIRLDGDEILRKKSKPVKEITPQVITLLDDMAETMKEANGVGLAAPQVGVLKRIIVVNTGGGLIELINPELIEKRGIQKEKEGCLSIPGKSGVVERPEYVKFRYMDREGNEQIIEGTELMAVVLCHETDHLDGILYTDKVIEMQEVDADDEDDEYDEYYDEGDE